MAHRCTPLLEIAFRRRGIVLLAGVLLIASGCREEVESPTAPAATPALAGSAAPLSFRQLSAGSRHTCGVTTDNQAYCWGSNGDGQLGDGTSLTHRAAPVAVAGGLRFQQISGGGEFTCGVTTDFKAYCWGQNTFGKLGDGTTVRRLTPTAVAGNLRFRQIDAGFYHTCGVTTDNAAYCWGWNERGRLGIGGSETRRKTPTLVAGGLKFRRVIAGGEHTCGLTLDNRAFCWGRNQSGQIGDGYTTDRWTPRHVAARRMWTQVGAGAGDRYGTGHSCGVTTENVAYCWGGNDEGQLGNGTTLRALRPAEVAGGLQFAGVSVGGDHNCGVTTAHRAYCWGWNYYGQLGDGTALGDHESHVPEPVTGGLFFDAVSAGATHTCGLTTGTRAYCWGAGGFLGDGTFDPSSTPVAVTGP